MEWPRTPNLLSTFCRSHCPPERTDREAAAIWDLLMLWRRMARWETPGKETHLGSGEEIKDMSITLYLFIKALAPRSEVEPWAKDPSDCVDFNPIRLSIRLKLCTLHSRSTMGNTRSSKWVTVLVETLAFILLLTLESCWNLTGYDPYSVLTKTFQLLLRTQLYSRK